MSDCGLHAFGTVFSEVWVASSDGTRIIRPAGKFISCVYSVIQFYMHAKIISYHIYIYYKRRALDGKFKFISLCIL